MGVAQISEGCPRSVPTISFGPNCCSPKGINTTAQGRDRRERTLGIQPPSAPTLKGLHPFRVRFGPGWNPFRVRSLAVHCPRVRDQSVATLGCDVRPLRGRGDSVFWLIADGSPLGCGYAAPGDSLTPQARLRKSATITAVKHRPECRWEVPATVHPSVPPAQ